MRVATTGGDGGYSPGQSPSLVAGIWWCVAGSVGGDVAMSATGGCRRHLLLTWAQPLARGGCERCVGGFDGSDVAARANGGVVIVVVVVVDLDPDPAWVCVSNRKAGRGWHSLGSVSSSQRRRWHSTTMAEGTRMVGG